MDTITIDEPIKIEAHDTPTEQYNQTTEDSQDEHEVKALSDTELREQLCSYGICPGPILPSTRTVYEKKLVRLMKSCPKLVAVKKSEVSNSENDGEKGQKAGGGEMVFESDNPKETTECTADNKPCVDVENRQKKLLSSDIEYSLAKIVAELQEILPEGKGATHRFQGQRKKVDSTAERVKDLGRKKMKSPSKDYGYPDTKATEETSTKRRTVSSIPSSVQYGDLNIKNKVVLETPESEFPSWSAKIFLFIILAFIVFLFLV